ncbi:MAG: NADH-quinone oxidoreductase subunit NuoG [Deltaproteobacteria bacterium]|nr:NADH-quinone oxidoreductase subunit NuoG [Deltaproteobacteria bacterium]
MPKLTIDDREIEVAGGTKVIEAAARLGIMIPRFCYHPALGSVGACRVCAVKVLEGPVKGVQMSCMLDAADGMQVSTTDREAVEFRRYVIEWLMMNHPHDCPVCDEGGHCLLQDMTVSGGHGIRRFPGKKRTYPDQDLGPLVQHEMNRCIHCYRCTRFYQQFCGYRDLGALSIGNRTYFGRVASGRLESPFSGNLSDICPTGVFTDKPSRYFGRRWDYQRTPTICINCSLGCHAVTSVRYRQVARQEARMSAAVNGWFLCDRGRYGFFYASLPGRPRQAAVKGETTTMDEAIAHARSRLETLPPDAIAVNGSARSSLEVLAMTERAARLKGWRGPAFFADAGAAHNVKTAIARLEEGLAVSLGEIGQADFILVVGADPINEAPMLALALRQAVQKGAGILVLDPRPVCLPFGFMHVPTAPEALGAVLGRLVKKSIGPAGLDGPAARFYASLPDEPATGQEVLARAAGLLAASRRPVIVCGTGIVASALVGLAADAALLLTAAQKKAGLFYILPEANSFASGLLAPPESTTDRILKAVVDGDVKALVFVENDPFATSPDRELLERALAKVELLVVLDYLDTPVSRRAHVFLPTQTLYESGGIFINQEGRAQYSAAAFAGGAPILETGGSDHPPRVYGTGLPGADPQPAGQIMAQLAGEPMASEIGARPEYFGGSTVSELAELPDVEAFPEEGQRLSPKNLPADRFKSVLPPSSAAESDELEIILTERTFGSEDLSSYSACLETREDEPLAGLHRRDAESLGIREGDGIAIRTGNTTLEFAVRVYDNMASGVMVVPRLQRLPWQGLGKRVRRQDIRKA